MSIFDIGVLISCIQKSFLIDERKSKERAWHKDFKCQRQLWAAGRGYWSQIDHFIRWGVILCGELLCQLSFQMQSQVRQDHTYTSCIQTNFLILEFSPILAMRQGISGFKEVRKASEKSWGTNGLMPIPPPVGCCLNPGVLWELSPSIGSQRQFFQVWSHQFLSEGSPSNVLPFCCAVTCVIPQFIALWAGSFYHERFLSVSFTLPLLRPLSISLPSVLLCLLLLKSYG